jgi:hypothetical protein
MKATDKKQAQYWSEYRKALLSDTIIEYQSAADIDRHLKELEADPIQWCKFFFRAYVKSDFASFQKKFIRRVTVNPEWYEVISWARELAKSTIVMFVVLYLVLTGKKRNVILSSSSYDNAERLLEPYRANLDSNPLIEAYYGKQYNPGHWESGEFVTKKGAAFRALGAGQSPRGSRNEEMRPDVLLSDDFDTDEDCRNIDTVKKKWDWFEQSLYPTRSISEELLVLWCGNIIAKDCCITRAGAMADHWDIINIRNKEGKSSWPEKNSEEDIDRVLSKISTRSAEQEYFNNPIAEGDVFKEMVWGKCPPLKKLQFVVIYADPATSNKDRQVKNRNRSYKSIFIIGHLDSKFYVYAGYLDQVKNYEFVEWFYFLRDRIGEKTQPYFYIENNSLQDPFFEQVFKPIFNELGDRRGHISITGDTRDKPDKYVRVEGNLEPLNRAGQLILNIDEKENPHMMRLEEQFLLVNPQMNAPADGPDCIEGGVWIVNQLIAALSFEPVYGKRTRKGEW